MRILVTGSRGHLGEALMRQLRGSTVEAIGLDRLPSPFTELVGSITDAALVARAMRGVDAVLHTATLHKPHLASHRRLDFIDVNLRGTQTLLDAAAAAKVRAFVFTSTTSGFGRALTPAAGEPAAWITEDVKPLPKNIYGVTKIAAEDLCELAARDLQLPCIVLRTSRFFPEGDDDDAARHTFADANLKLNELLYRRVDLADVVDAHLLAIERAPALRFDRFIISATTPFTRDDLPALRSDPATVVARHVPDYAAEYAARGWRLPVEIERVYVNERARRVLGWRPRHDFASALKALRATGDFRSALARAVGAKGYHAEA